MKSCNFLMDNSWLNQCLRGRKRAGSSGFMGALRGQRLCSCRAPSSLNPSILTISRLGRVTYPSLLHAKHWKVMGKYNLTMTPLFSQRMWVKLRRLWLSKTILPKYGFQGKCRWCSFVLYSISATTWPITLRPLTSRAPMLPWKIEYSEYAPRERGARLAGTRP